MAFEASKVNSALTQGELLSNVLVGRLDLNCLFEPEKAVELVTHPFVVVLSQDCDLETDFLKRIGKRKTGSLLPNILLCEADYAENLRGDAGLKSAQWKLVRQNDFDRFHYLRGISPEHDAVGEGITPLAIDFKKYFTVPGAELYLRIGEGQARRRAALISPYKEHISSRFYAFQSRIALPVPHHLAST